MLVRRWLLSALLALLLAMPAAAIEADETLTAEQGARYQQLLLQLRCLVCQNQSLADSPASFAQDMRTVLKQKIVAGEADVEIFAFMTKRYGDFILYRPPFNAATGLLWLLPFVVLLIGVWVVARLLRRSATAAGDNGDDGDDADADKGTTQ